MGSEVAEGAMRGRLVERVWEYNSVLDAPTKYRRACRYHAFVPDPVSDLRFTMDAAVAGLVSEAEAAIRALNAVAVPALQPFSRLLLRTESIASSKVEGMQMNAREVARAEAKLEAGIRVGVVAAEVVANIEAMELAIEEAARADRLSIAKIEAIHEKLMSRSATAHHAGRLRTVQNWIGGNDYNPCGAEFVPPPPELVDELLTDVCRSMADETLSPLVQAAVVHAQFETIHPFDDGNGRVGRALIHVVLRKRGLAPDYVPPISLVLAENTRSYIDGLTQFRNGDVAGWVERFAAAAARSARLATVYLAAVRELMSDWRLRLEAAGPIRSHAAAHAIIDLLPAYPIITTTLAAAATGRARSSVHTAIETLESAGVLIPLSTSKRNRSWEANGLLELLSRMEAGQLPHEEGAE